MGGAIKSVNLKNGSTRYELYLHLGNKQFRRRFSTKKAAEKAETLMKAEILTGKGISKNYTWKTFFEKFIEAMSITLKKTTIVGYQSVLNKHIMPVWKNRFVKDITPFDVRCTLDNIDGSEYTRKNVLKMIRAVFNHAIHEGIIGNNPCGKIKIKLPDGELKILSREEIKVLLQEAFIQEHPWYSIWAVALLTGLRSGELYALRWIDIDFENERLYIKQSWNNLNGYGPTKNYHNRIIPISAELKRLLMEMKLKRTDEFVLPHLADWSKGYQAKILKKFCREIGITEIRFHDLRAVFITQLLLANVSPVQTMQIVGHSDLKITMRYVRLIAQDLKNTTDKLNIELPTNHVNNVVGLAAK